MTPERRVLLAFALSLFVMLAWQWVIGPPPPPEGDPAGAEGETRAAVAETPPIAPPAGRPETAPPTSLAIATPDLRLGLSAEGGVLTTLRLERFLRHGADEPVELVGSEHETVPRLHPLALVADTPDLGGLGRAPHVLAESAPAGAVAGLAVAHPLLGPLRLSKSIALAPEGYRADLVVRIENPTETPASLAAVRFVFPDGTRRAGSLLLHWSDLGRNDPPPLWRDQHVVSAAYAGPDGTMRAPPIEPGFFAGLRGPPAPALDVRWAALQDRYFTAAFVPRFEGLAAHFEREDGAIRMWLVLPPADVPPLGAVEFPFTLYAGPKETDRLAAADPALQPLDGMEPSVLPFSLARPTVKILMAIERLVGNYGWAIIVITILVKIVLYPLTAISLKSMAKMKALAPQVEELKKKHGDDKERLNREMLKLYADAGANPLGGCLPMLLQIPVFIALYQALQWSVELRGAPFVWWIRDLSAPDTVFTFVGIPVNILPAAMGGTMLLQQTISTPPTADPSQAQTMKIMTVVMTVLFWNLPSGLTLYWTVQNILSIAQQWAMEWRESHA